MMNPNSTEEFCMIIPKCRPPIRTIEISINNESINYGRIIPKCRPPIRNIKECENKDNNNDKNNNKNNNNTKEITLVLERIIKMNNPSKTNSTTTDDSTDYSDDDISNNDRSKEDSNATKSSSDNSSLHDSTQKSKSPPRSNDETKKNNIEDNKNIESSRIRLFFCLIMVVIAIYLCDPFKGNNHQSNDQLTQNNRIEMITKFRKSVASVKSKFKSQTSYTWNAFQSQVEDVINENSKVSIVILLGNEINTIKCFAHLLGDVSSKVLGNNSYLLLNTRNIGNDHGEVIFKWKPKIQENKVVIIEDLLNMESESIKALHNLCDRENPLVSKSLYIITIMSNGYQGLHKDKFVENILTAKFSKTIDLDVLIPLITRIMDGPIIPIVPESNMKGKHSITECLLL